MTKLVHSNMFYTVQMLVLLPRWRQPGSQGVLTLYITIVPASSQHHLSCLTSLTQSRLCGSLSTVTSRPMQTSASRSPARSPLSPQVAQLISLLTLSISEEPTKHIPTMPSRPYSHQLVVMASLIHTVSTTIRILGTRQRSRDRPTSQSRTILPL